MLSVFFIFPVRAKNTFGKKKDKVTRLHFYDLNKNGRMDTYENPSAPVEYRVEHLLSQMTLEEKVGQMLTSLGWPMYERVGEDIRLTPQLEKEIGEYATYVAYRTQSFAGCPSVQSSSILRHRT